MTEIDAQRLSDILSIGISKLLDRQRIAPALPPRFWIEMRYFIRDEVRGFEAIPDLRTTQSKT